MLKLIELIQSSNIFQILESMDYRKMKETELVLLHMFNLRGFFWGFYGVFLHD